MSTKTERALRRDLAGRAAGPWVVTGAASGFGREFARRLAAYGAPLALWDANAQGLAEALDELRSLGARGEALSAHTVDVRERASIDAALAATEARHGAPAHLVHCAGILRVGAVAQARDEDFEAMIAVNYLGTVRVTRALLPSLVRRGAEGAGRATLLLVSSLAGLRGFAEMSGYCASKHAVTGFAQALYDELALERAAVTLRLLCPPPADTPMVRALEGPRPAVYKLSRLFRAEQVVREALGSLRDEGRSWQVVVGAEQRALRVVEQLAPRVFERGMHAALRALK